MDLKFLFKKISISSDHAGFKLKENIKRNLKKKKITVIDLGPRNDGSVDYPDFAKKVARNVSSKKSNIGILVCGSGTGMAMSANKFKKIRAAVCYNKASTSLSRKHNNANILALGSRLTKKSTALKLVNIFLSTKFEGGRHLRRVKKV
ncbi:MAG: ribose 5-phosphate isomerase B [Pelagibacteraceae bacterium TMED247]|nr:ribose 5-phosphate isomerase B [Candidatus Pelagibacter sp.]RPG05792.1 MAG: ribose 5-phosphate isomerase B [Pelagibacteraceae bacterium TMED247]